MAWVLSGHDDVALFEWRRQRHWIDTKTDIYEKSELMDKLINRIPGSGLWISSLSAQASRMHVESLA